MIRFLLILLSLTTAAAFAASPDLRAAAMAQLRSIAEPLFEHGAATEPRFDAFYTEMVEALPPQEKAEQSLELAINRRDGAAEYVMQNAQAWRGQFKSTPKLRTLINTSADAPLIEIRMAGFEIYLAQYGLEKSPAEVDRMLQQMAANPSKSSAWALWNIGVLGARGVDRERVFRELLSALNSGDQPLRRSALEALAKFGGAEIVPPLLEIASHEPDPVLRERAFCALAQSGTLLVAERYEAVPGLFAIVEDVQSDKQSVLWAYQALREITDSYGEPNDAAKWRDRLQQAGLL
ncbi:MAG: HEAT repeat domain-containing protein [Xanthomonadales bacterium]|nr:HEAT repeat domain-containing protein [Xanthomonadales bacterium]